MVYKLNLIGIHSAGNTDSVKQALEGGADPDWTNWMKHTLLHEAAERGLVPFALPQFFPGHAKVVDALINFGADVNRLGTDQRTCLHLACEKGNFMAASALINAGSNIRAKGRQ